MDLHFAGLCLISMLTVAMGPPVPEPFVWDPALKTYYVDLDNQHKQLFQALLTWGLNEGSETAAENAYNVLASHFLYEEAYMQVAKYGGYDDHKAAHEEFLSEVKAKGSAYAKDWLVNHIKNVDFKFIGQL